MTFKILLPALVAALLYLLGRSHARRGRLSPATPPGEQSSFAVRWRRSFRLTAYLLAGMALLTTVWVIHEEWQSAHRRVTIRVIHVQTGETTLYQARQGEVHGRTFQTLDGRQVRLADVERMEVGEAESTTPP
ncbi:MAG: hypothetical protein HQL88_06865 [Magnetococcales bacterium]|nr:hypothetical protein [Magnetococcales bacterium]